MRYSVHTLAFLVFSFFAKTTIAQGPGFMGKQNLIGINYNFTTDLDGSYTTESLNLYETTGDSKYVQGFGVSFERIRTKSTSIVVGINRNMLKYKYYQSYYLDNTITPLKGDIYLNQTSIDIGFKGYSKKEFAAPMGPYSQLDLRFATTKADYSEFGCREIFDLYDANTQTTTTEVIEYDGDIPKMVSSYQSIGFGLTLGTNWVITESLLIDFSLKGTFMISGTAIGRPYNTLRSSDSFIKKQTYFDDYNKAVTMLNNLLWVSVGLKFMK